MCPFEETGSRKSTDSRFVRGGGFAFLDIRWRFAHLSAAIDGRNLKRYLRFLETTRAKCSSLQAHVAAISHLCLCRKIKGELVHWHGIISVQHPCKIIHLLDICCHLHVWVCACWDSCISGTSREINKFCLDFKCCSVCHLWLPAILVDLVSADLRACVPHLTQKYADWHLMYAFAFTCTHQACKPR